MGLYRATVAWTARDGDDFAARRYSRAHRWRFDGGAEVAASASPQIVPEPWSDPAGVDPEEAMVAALSSCHMLFFLDFATRDGWVVTAYRDEAVGEMGRRDDGHHAMTGVTLRPVIEFARAPDAGTIAALHERAHDACFLANSVAFPVIVVTPRTDR